MESYRTKGSSGEVSLSQKRNKAFPNGQCRACTMHLIRLRSCAGFLESHNQTMDNGTDYVQLESFPHNLHYFFQRETSGFLGSLSFLTVKSRIKTWARYVSADSGFSWCLPIQRETLSLSNTPRENGLSLFCSTQGFLVLLSTEG